MSALGAASTKETGEGELDGIDIADLFDDVQRASAPSADIDDASLMAFDLDTVTEGTSPAALRLSPAMLLPSGDLLRVLGVLGDPRELLSIPRAPAAHERATPTANETDSSEYAAAHAARMPLFLRMLVLAVLPLSSGAHGTGSEPGRCVLCLALTADAAEPDGVSPRLIAVCLRGDWLAGAEHLRAGVSVVHVIASCRGAPTTARALHTPVSRLAVFQATMAISAADATEEIAALLRTCAQDARVAACVLAGVESQASTPDENEAKDAADGEAHLRRLRGRFSPLRTVLLAAARGGGVLSAVAVEAAMRARDLNSLLCEFAVAVLDTHALAAAAAAESADDCHRNEHFSSHSFAASQVQSPAAASSRVAGPEKAQAVLAQARKAVLAAVPAGAVDGDGVSLLIVAAVLAASPSVQPLAVAGALALGARERPVMLAVDATANAIILHPDTLLAPTKIASVFTCMRRAVLGELYGSQGDVLTADAGATASPAALMGSLKHELFQAALHVATGSATGLALARAWREQADSGPAVEAAPQAGVTAATSSSSAAGGVGSGVGGSGRGVYDDVDDASAVNNVHSRTQSGNISLADVRAEVLANAGAQKLSMNSRKRARVVASAGEVDTAILAGAQPVTSSQAHGMAHAAGPLSGADLSAMLRGVARGLVRSAAHMTELLACGVADGDALRELCDVVPGIVDWLRCYVGLPEAPEHPLAAPGAPHRPFTVLRVVGTEDALWSPVWGMKGIIDATVDIQLTPPAVTGGTAVVAAGAAPAARARWPVVRVPWELKTGRRPLVGTAANDHRAQLVLYALLVGERYEPLLGEGEAAALLAARARWLGGFAPAAPETPPKEKQSRLFLSPWTDMGAWASCSASYDTASPIASASASAADATTDVDHAAEASVKALIVYLAPNLSANGRSAGGASRGAGSLQAVTAHAEACAAAAAAAAPPPPPPRWGNPPRAAAYAMGPPAGWSAAHFTAALPASWAEQRPLITTRNELAVAVKVARDAAEEISPQLASMLLARKRAGAQQLSSAEILDTSSLSASSLSSSASAAAGAPLLLSDADLSNPLLPPLLQSPRLCMSCFALTTCTAVYATRELPLAELAARARTPRPLHGDGETPIPMLAELSTADGLREVYVAATRHLTRGGELSSYTARWLAAIDWEDAGVQLLASPPASPSLPLPLADIEDSGLRSCQLPTPPPPSLPSPPLHPARAFWSRNASAKEATGSCISELVLLAQLPAGGSAAEEAAAAASVAVTPHSLPLEGATEPTDDPPVEGDDSETVINDEAASSHGSGGLSAAAVAALSLLGMLPVGDGTCSADAAAAMAAASKGAPLGPKKLRAAAAHERPLPPPMHFAAPSSPHRRHGAGGGLVTDIRGFFPAVAHLSHARDAAAAAAAKSATAATGGSVDDGDSSGSTGGDGSAGDAAEASAALPEHFDFLFTTAENWRWQQQRGRREPLTACDRDADGDVGPPPRSIFLTLASGGRAGGGAAAGSVTATAASSAAAVSGFAAHSAATATDEGLRLGSYVILSGARLGPYSMISGILRAAGPRWLLVRGRRDALAAFPAAFARAVPAPFLWRLDAKDGAGAGAYIQPTVAVQKGNVVRMALGNAGAAVAAYEADDARRAARDRDAGDSMSQPGPTALTASEPAPVHSSAPAFELLSTAAVKDAALQISDDEGSMVWDDAALNAAEEAARAESAPSAAAVTTVTNDEASLPPNLLPGDLRRQKLIIDLAAPRFWRTLHLPWAPQPATAVVPSSGHTALRSAIESELNDDQRGAVAAILAARDYCIVVGLPGTGKTTALTLAVRALVASGRSVLISSHTHSAVDTLLEKLVADGAGADVLRVGAPASVAPALRRFTLDAAVSSGALPSVGHLRHRSLTAPIVGVTCLGLSSHPLFAMRSFDVAIVDEAGQVPEPVALGALRLARTFVLVGDPRQLPPLATSPVAAAAGYGASLLRRLSTAHPAAVVTLRMQYRMCDDICALANEVAYGGDLRCATPVVASRRMALKESSGASARAAAHAARADATPLPSWVTRAADARTSVLFLDTDALTESFLSATADARVAAAESSLTATTDAPAPRCVACACAGSLPDDDGAGRWEEGGMRSTIEARALTAVAVALVRAGAQGAQIGVIAPFNAQVAALRVSIAAAAAAAAATATAEAEVPAALASAADTGCNGSGVDRFRGGVSGRSNSSSDLRRVEVETVDRFQGRDKDCVLLSFARGSRRWVTDGSAGSGAPSRPRPPAVAAGSTLQARRADGGALDSIERLAVALTRAKGKLILIGSAAALRASSPALASLVRACERRGWLEHLPPADPASGAAALLQHPLHRLSALYCACGCHGTPF